MAFFVKPNQLTFFESTFGKQHKIIDKVKQLVGAGYEFDITLWSISFQGSSGYGVQKLSVVIGTTTLMKSSKFSPSIQEKLEKAKIESWVDELYAKKFPESAKLVESPIVSVAADSDVTSVVTITLTGMTASANMINAIKVIRDLTQLGLKEAKDIVDAVKADNPYKLTLSMEKAVGAQAKLAQAGFFLKDILNPPSAPNVFPVVKKKGVATTEVIQLRDAAALNQRVHGTSTGSIYRVIAFNDRIKVAARIREKGSISIRVEWTKLTPEEKEALVNSELSMHDNYGSLHLEAQSVPVARIIGGILLGLGLTFEEQVVSANQLHEGED